MELERPPPSYAIDTVEALGQRGSGSRIFLPRRRRQRRAACRPGIASPELAKLVQFVVLDRTGLNTAHPYPAIRRHLDISATDIRNRVASGRSIRYLVPPAVEDIIRDRQLYREPSEITAENLAKTCADLAANKKAEDIVVLDLRGISTFTDFFVICSGTSEPHLKAIAGEIEGRLKDDHGVRASFGRWISGEPMDRARLHAGHRARLPPRKTRVLQPGRSWGDAPVWLGSRRTDAVNFPRRRPVLLRS